jgi:hypothetical protein
VLVDVVSEGETDRPSCGGEGGRTVAGVMVGIIMLLAMPMLLLLLLLLFMFIVDDIAAAGGDERVAAAGIELERSGEEAGKVK